MRYPIKLFNKSELLSLSSDYLLDYECLDYECLDSTEYGSLLEIKLMIEYKIIKNYIYCKIGEYYYMINNIESISKDTCKIRLLTDDSLTHTMNLEYLLLWGKEENLNELHD